MKQVAFRVASNARAGGGHVLRCLAIAEVVRALGNVVSFVVDSVDDLVVNRILLAGYSVEADSDKVRENITINLDAILIDSYELNHKDIQFWCNKGTISLVFDDYDRGCNFSSGRIVAKPLAVNKNIREKVFYGVDFIPLGSNFRKLASLRVGPVREVLFMFGLRDSVGATLMALEVWRELSDQLSDVNVTCIVGSICPHLNEIHSLIDKMGDKARIFVDKKNVGHIITKIDIAIGAAGLGLYERACAGLVNIAIPIAENQKPLSQWLANCGGCITLDFDHTSLQKNLRKNILELVSNADERRAISRNAMLLVDGYGAKRIANELLL